MLPFYWCFQSSMFIGPAGSQKLCSLGGDTVHRRRITVLKILIDFHCRVSARDLESDSFSDPTYPCRLGEALGTASSTIYDDFCGLALRRATNQDVGRTTRTPMYFSFPEDLPLYLGLLETDFGQMLRNMMSKFT